MKNIENYKMKNAPRRRGFTLVEVLVVIAIIGMLAAFLLPAIMSAKKKGKITAIKMEMAQLATAIENFRTNIGVGQYPPDGTSPADTVRFLKAAFPRCPASNYPNALTTSNQSSPFNPTTALCLWLGGAQDSSGQFIGFSANPQNPFDGSPGRIQPSYDFGNANSNGTRFDKAGALSGGGVAGTWNLYHEYFPNNGQAVGVAMPYVYLKAVAGSYTTNGVTIKDQSTSIGNTWAYLDSTSSGTFINPKSYQLLCPGLDGKYGIYASQPSFPGFTGGVALDTVNGTDDMSNFTQGPTIGDDVQ